jgi:copper chaperone NosL
MKNLILILFVIVLASCSHEPQQINYSKDACDFCKMTIMDPRFTAECISTKGKVFKFDDAHCLVTFLKVGGVWKNEIEAIYFSEYTGKNEWIKSDKVLFLKSPDLHSPMGGNVAAFKSKEDRDIANKQFNGVPLTWEELKAEK